MSCRRRFSNNKSNDGMQQVKKKKTRENTLAFIVCIRLLNL